MKSTRPRVDSGHTVYIGEEDRNAAPSIGSPLLLRMDARRDT